MNLFSRVWNRLSSGAQEAKAVDFDLLISEALSGNWGLPTKSGAQVSLNSSLMTTAFYRGVMSLADGEAQLPIEIYKRSSDKKSSEKAVDHPLYEVLSHRANNLQDSFQFWRTLIMYTVATGDGVCFKNVVNGQVRELMPVRPECVTIDLTAPFNERLYGLSFETGMYEQVGQQDVFHLQGPSWRPHRGLDPSVIGREAIGLAQATEETHARFHQNGTRPAGVITTPVKLDDKDIARLRTAWQATFSGTKNVGQTPILGGGLKFEPMAMSGVDSEHLDTRKHQIEEIARLLGIFPIMLGHAGDQSPTFASADAFLEAHVRYSLQPLFKAVISAVQTQLLTKDEIREGYYCRIDSSELLRGSLKDRTEYYKAALGTIQARGWLKGNEVREDDGWNADEDPEMDKVWQPAVTAPAGVKPEPSPTPELQAKSIVPRTLYVSRKLLNASDVVKWAKEQGLTGLLAASDLHVTVAFSTRKFDWMAAGDSHDAEIVVNSGGPRVVEPIGVTGAIAIKFSSWSLALRNHEITEAGASWDYEEYQPHVTLTYEKQTVNIEKIEPYRGELRFGPEIFEEIKETAH